MTRRQKLIVMKCRCGCGKWAAFQSRPQFDDQGIAKSVYGMYSDTWRGAVTTAIRWTTRS